MGRELTSDVPGSLVKQIRDAAGWTQEEMGRELGYENGQGVHLIETGKRPITLVREKLLRRIAEEVGVAWPQSVTPRELRPGSKFTRADGSAWLVTTREGAERPDGYTFCASLDTGEIHSISNSEKVKL